MVYVCQPDAKVKHGTWMFLRIILSLDYQASSIIIFGLCRRRGTDVIKYIIAVSNDNLLVTLVRLPNDALDFYMEDFLVVVLVSDN